MLPRHLSPEVAAALKSVRFIAQHIKDADKDNEVRDFFCLVSGISFADCYCFIAWPRKYVMGSDF